MDDDHEVKIGWYSAAAAEHIGSCVWATPDGREVVVTGVTDEVTVTYQWEDRVRVGEVTRWVRDIDVLTKDRRRGGR